MNRIPMFRLISGYGIGIGSHIESARVSAKVGAIMKSRDEDVRGRRGSLINNLIASANG